MNGGRRKVEDVEQHNEMLSRILFGKNKLGIQIVR
ncbi:hypothetical protein THOM_1864 [Trachipleistophora hominis]|uniref:Uncharacterized protein n=1 Tax=Trachipleistophora hominis TaxID=72359 RepID=L7JW32_TRAHO|nr:hypothetical protein THOM_1864 [Trachipleistophora hominis]